jgi:hypothetical protein
MDTKRADAFYRSQAGRITIVIAFAILVGLVAWLALRGSNNSSSTTTPPTTTARVTTTSKTVTRPTVSPVGPVIVAPKALKTASVLLHHAVYWAGALKGFSYELTVTSNARFYVRYLPAGVKAGDKRANFLTVGTYPVANAYAVTKTAAKGKGDVTVQTQGGGIGFFNTDRPTNVYVAYPNVDYQIEVFSPSAARALNIAEKGLSPIS